MIVGFPGETDSDFEDTMSLLEEVQFHGSYSFKYSDRPGTRSADFENKIEESLKAERLLRFQTRQDEICLEHNQKYINQTLSMMVEKNNGKALVARTEATTLFIWQIQQQKMYQEIL